MTNKFEGFNWSDEDYQNFGLKTQLLKHNYHKSEIFSDTALEELLDKYPRHNLQCYTMGTNPENHNDWTPVHIAERSGAEIMQALQKGRFWINLINLDQFSQDYADLVNDIYQRISSNCSRLANIKPAFNALLISSPGIQVYCHVDADANMLWHLKGRKRAWVYPHDDKRFTPQSYIEEIVAQERHENIPYQKWFDDFAFYKELEAGEVVSWPQHSPHRIENVDVNVSITTSYASKDSRRLIGVYGFNHHFLKKMGVKNRSIETKGLIPVLKEFIYFSFNRLGLLKKGERTSTYTSDIQVDHTSETGMSKRKEKTRTAFSYSE